MTSASERNEMNRAVIEQFRSNGGNVDGRPLLLLSTTGAKTGQKRVTPLMYLQDGGRWVVFASKGGAPTNPDWYHNLLANPAATVEVGTETFEADSTVLAGEERDRIYSRLAQLYPMFAEYEQRAAPRKIPVVALARK